MMIDTRTCLNGDDDVTVMSNYEFQISDFIHTNLQPALNSVSVLPPSSGGWTEFVGRCQRTPSAGRLSPNRPSHPHHRPGPWSLLHPMTQWWKARSTVRSAKLTCCWTYWCLLISALNENVEQTADATDEHGLCCALKHACEETGRHYSCWKASASVITGTSLLWDQHYIPSTMFPVDILSECSRDLVLSLKHEIFPHSYTACFVSAPFPCHSNTDLSALPKNTVVYLQHSVASFVCRVCDVNINFSWQTAEKLRCINKQGDLSGTHTCSFIHDVGRMSAGCNNQQSGTF